MLAVLRACRSSSALALSKRPVCRLLSSPPAAEQPDLTERVRVCLHTLKPTLLHVQDLSGGCGAMLQLTVQSPLFRGKRIIEQHRMVNEAIAAEVAGVHGITIKTSATPE